MSFNEITVVEYVNPHFFWIRETEDLDNLKRIENCLNRDVNKTTPISPEANELVAVQNVGIFKRAIVVDVNNGYNCWLLDYAQHVFARQVYNLPDSFVAIAPTIKPAALNDIVGIRHRLNFETCKDEAEVGPHFDAHTIQTVKDKLSQAKHVYFYKERTIGDMICGSLVLVSDDDQMNLADLLIQEGHAAVNKELFLKALSENSLKIPITASHDERSMLNYDNVCSVEGVGRGRHRSKATSDKEQQIDAWLKNVVNEVSSAHDIRDSAKDQDVLSSLSDISENNISDTSQMMVSDYSNSGNASFSGTSSRSDTNLSARKIRGRGNLLSSENNNCLNKGDAEIIKQEIAKNEGAKDLKVLVSNESPIKKRLKSSDILKLIPRLDIGRNIENKQVMKNCEESSVNTKKSTSTIGASTLTSTSSSVISGNGKNPLKPTNFSSTSDTSSLVLDEQSAIKPENCSNNMEGVIMTNSFPCKCEHCQKVFDDDLDETPKTFTDEVKHNDQFHRGKPQRLIKSDISKSDTLMIKKFDRNQTKIEKDMAPNLLIHSPGHCPTPTPDLCKVPFCIPVHKALTALKYKVPRSMQMYMWPALMRSMNACIVNARSSGKTMCYIPALCSFLIQKGERYPFLPKEPSPIAVILCNSIKEAEEIFDLLRVFLSHTCKKVDIALLVPPIEELLPKLLKRAEIIVSTPRMFVRILVSRTINLKRLCHLIIENTDEILNETSVELGNIVKAIQSMLDHRVFINSVQIIMTSQKWTIALEDFIRYLEVAPVLCIGSHLESVIYAKANIEMHFVKKDEKTKHICAILKEYSKDLKTVIVCSTDDEVLEVAEYFQILGISVISATRSMGREEIQEKEVLWFSAPLKNNSVFVCTDYILHTQLSITTAQILINYSLPSDSWSLFSRRFKCVVDTHDSPFNAKFNRANVVKVHIFVDETCSKQFPRLYYFLQQMKTKLPEHFKSFCEKLECAEESVKIENEKPICKRLKLLGKCTKFRCEKRHLFSPYLDLGEDVPSCGIIKFQVLRVADVTQLGIKVLKHWGTNREKKDLVDYTDLVTKELQRCMTARKLIVTDVKVGSLYVYLNAKEVSYRRCKILKILSRQQITNAAHEVMIKLIDDGTEKKAFTSVLFQLPSEYLEIPPQSIDARVVNMVPLEHDTEWNLRTKCKVEKMINDLIERYPEAYFVGKIVLQVGGTVWLEDLIMREDVESSKETVTILTLKRKLINMDLVDYNESPLKNLEEVCLKSGFNLPIYDMDPAPEPQKVQKTTQVSPQWAHLSTKPDVYNVVYFSHGESPQKFYVKLEKYYDLLMDLEEEIQSGLEKPFYPTIEEIIPGNCYLAKDSGGDNYNRVVVKEIKGENAECFFADYGDTVDVPSEELKYLSNEYISRLPFQAIECELYGIKPIMDVWPLEAVNVFYKFCYQPDTDIYRDLFVNVVNSEPSRGYGGKRYSVAMLDYFENKRTVINKILVDCGLAIDDDFENIEDLVLPEYRFCSEEVEEDNANNDDNAMGVEESTHINMKEFVKCLRDKCELPQNMEEILEDVDRCSFENGGWDFECSDFRKFMSELAQNGRILQKKDPVEVEQPSCSSSSKDQFIPMKAAPSGSRYSPNVLWHQTKLNVIMEIQLQNVQDYSAIVLKKKVFIFSTKINDRDYMLNFPLFDSVTHMEKSNTGLHVKVTLRKVKEDEWPRLVNSEEKMKNIKYDLTKLEVEEPKKRRFLDHGFGFDEDDEDYPTIHNISSEEDTDSDLEGCDDVR